MLIYDEKNDINIFHFNIIHIYWFLSKDIKLLYFLAKKKTLLLIKLDGIGRTIYITYEHL